MVRPQTGQRRALPENLTPPPTEPQTGILPKPSPRRTADERQLHIDALPRDSVRSAKIALIAIDRSLAAWARPRNHFAAEHGDTILDVLVQLERLRRAAEAKFPAAREFERPGFD